MQPRTLQMKAPGYFSILIVILISISSTLLAQTKSEVLIVLGSDTAIWDGMSTTRYNNTYNQALYTDPAGNAYEVMNSGFLKQEVIHQIPAGIRRAITKKRGR